MKVSISIPCRNEDRYIGKCLQSIIDCDYPKSLLNVYVVDGISDDGTRDIIKSFEGKAPYIHLIDNHKRTTPFALNIGLQKDDSEVKIILGAHATIAIDFVSEAVETLKNDPSLGCAGGIINNVYENKEAEIIGLAMSSSFGVGNARFRTGGDDGYADTVAFGAYKREVFHEIGYFDEDLVRNQDDEYNFRLLKNGYKIWLTSRIQSNYYVRGSYTKLFRQYYQYGYWKVLVNTKHKTVTTFRQIIPLLFVLYLLLGAVLPVLPLFLKCAYLSMLLIYFLGAFYFSSKQSNGRRLVFSIVKVFLILHLSYGWGYLVGVYQFVLKKQKPSSKSKVMSR